MSRFVEIAKKVCPAVITIVISKYLPKIEGFYFFPFGEEPYILPKIGKKKEKTKIGGGSGFLVSEDGYILTCNHVVSDPSAEYTVIFSPEKKYKAKVLAREELIDVAVIKIEDKNLPYLELGDSSKVQLGEEVLAVGNPLGEFEDTVSAGIVSGLSRKITAYGDKPFKMMSLRGLIQTDAAINPGNSGGPLVDMEGKVIGINTAMVVGAENLGFAIPINYAKEVLHEVKKYGKVRKPYLGIRYIIITKELAEFQKLPVDYGALVIRERFGEPAVIKNSPADKAKIKEYDIILELGGEKVTPENTLADILQKHKIGEKLKAKILRNKKEITVEITLEEKK
jgi:serine protease Do